MDFTIYQMDSDAALAISTWTYDEPYDFYNLDDSQQAIDELLNGYYFKVVDDKQILAGYCCVGPSAQVPVGATYGAYPTNGTVDVGLGMRPDLTGKGQGYDFFCSILKCLKSIFGTDSFRLTVAKFNGRAIKLYEKLGFIPIMVFQRDNVEFITMENTPPMAKGDR